MIIVSDAHHPPEQALNPAQAAYWEKTGIIVIRQTESGGVTLRPTPDGGLIAHGFLHGEWRLPPRGKR